MTVVNLRDNLVIGRIQRRAYSLPGIGRAFLRFRFLSGKSRGLINCFYSLLSLISPAARGRRSVTVIKRPRTQLLTLSTENQ